MTYCVLIKQRDDYNGIKTALLPINYASISLRLFITSLSVIICYHWDDEPFFFFSKHYFNRINFQKYVQIYKLYTKFFTFKSNKKRKFMYKR